MFVINYIFYFMRKSQQNDTARRLAIPPKHRLAILNKLYDFVLDCAEESNTKPFLTYGTLLGKVRDNSIICYDFDLDFGIHEDEYSSLKDKLIEKCPNNLRINVKDFLMFKSIEIVHKKTRLSADIFAYSVNDKVCRCIPEIYSKYVSCEPHFFSKNDFFPLKKCFFLGRECYLPNKPEKLLESWYSKNFMIPDKICDSNCLNCRPNPNR